MNVLFVVPYVPSLVRVRPWNLIRHLSARGHRVVVATLWTNDRERTQIDALRSVCHDVRAVRAPVWRSLLNCVRALPAREPLQAVYSWSPELSGQIGGLASWADVLHVEHLRGARYGLRERASGPESLPPVVWDAVDCISYLFDQAVQHRSDRIGKLITRIEVARTRRHEARLLSRFDRVTVTSRIDRDALTALGEPSLARRVAVVPNGVDTNYFSPGTQPRHARRLVFSGKMSYHANVSAARRVIAEVMPRVWARDPDVELWVVGQAPPPELRALAADYGSRVVVTGTVEDIRPFLREATAAVVPLVYGAGIQNKVLEAMACATPVVATARAVSALAAHAGRDVLVADGSDEFARIVTDLLASPSRQRWIGEAGRRYVERHHRWSETARQLEGLYEEVIAQRSRGSATPKAGLVHA